MQAPREAIKFAKNHLGEVNTIVEVGIGAGHNARTMLEHLDPKRFYLVDGFWRNFDSFKDYKCTPEEIYANHDLCLRLCENTLSKDHRYRLINAISIEAVNEVPNELDLVYIDANHLEHAVLEDIKVWYPKIRKGGVLCGHDWYAEGVERAVKLSFDFFDTQIPSELRHDRGYGAEGSDWWLIKRD